MHTDTAAVSCAVLLLSHICATVQPSMQQLHMHIISEDMNSESLKNKKHWNSFCSEFFVSAVSSLAVVRVFVIRAVVLLIVTDSSPYTIVQVPSRVVINMLEDEGRVWFDQAKVKFPLVFVHDGYLWMQAETLLQQEACLGCTCLVFKF